MCLYACGDCVSNVNKGIGNISFISFSEGVGENLIKRLIKDRV